MLNLKYFMLFLLTINLKVNAQDSTKPTEKVESIQRILEGRLTHERDHRYMVAVMRLANDSLVPTCGGAIVHRRYVLTAANCVHRYRSHELVVRHGGASGPDRLTPPEDDLRSYHPVAKTFVPKVYSSTPCRKHHYDIAILKVAQIFDLADFTRFAKVNLPEFDSDYEGFAATVTGYGPDFAPLKEEQYQKRYLQYVVQLREMPVTVISNEECQYQADVVLTEGSLCARAENPASHTCFEDDGGPLVHDGTIIGILNNRRCDYSVPELFTRVSAYLPFIKNVLEHQLSFDIVIS